jgi:hypothetical protein
LLVDRPRRLVRSRNGAATTAGRYFGASGITKCLSSDVRHLVADLIAPVRSVLLPHLDDRLQRLPKSLLRGDKRGVPLCRRLYPARGIPPSVLVLSHLYPLNPV